MKKVMVLLIALLLLVMCSACSNQDDSSDSTNSSKSADSVTAAPKKITSVAVGDVVTFGKYPQTAAGTDQTPIEWIVLDVQDGKALLLSKYGLEMKQYNTEYTDITWETCTLRTWLNSDFLNKAFSSEEQSAILIT